MDFMMLLLARRDRLATARPPLYPFDFASAAGFWSDTKRGSLASMVGQASSFAE
jgi:hypothetical protein